MLISKRKVFSFIKPIGLIILLHTACGNDKPTNNSANDTKVDLSEKIPVETAMIQKGNVVDVVSATGTIFPLHDVLVSSETAGRVTEVYVEVGDYVRKDLALVQIDPELKQLALEQAEAAFIEAKATYDKMTKDFERNKKLFENKDISEYVFETARLQKESAEAAFLTAQANVKMAKRQLKDARVQSPVDGYVAARLVELGSMVSPGTPIAKVVDISRVKVKFGVPEKDIVKMHQGQTATITVDSYPEQRFTGNVTAVGPQADLSTRTFPVEILVENPKDKLKAGMVAKIEIAAEMVAGVPLLPKSALLERSGQTIIFVIMNGKAEKRIPQLGLESGDKIALLGGAEIGEQVVVLGQENLLQGAEVEVKQESNGL